MTAKEILRLLAAALLGVLFVSWALVGSPALNMILPALIFGLFLASKLNLKDDLLVIVVAVIAGLVAFFVPAAQLPGDPRLLEVYILLVIWGLL